MIARLDGISCEMVKEPFHGLGFVGFRQRAGQNLDLAFEDLNGINASISWSS